jgi:hypothetical protein
MRVLWNIGYGAISAVPGLLTGAWIYGMNVTPCQIPDMSALHQMQEKQENWFADCYVLRVPRSRNTRSSFSGVKETDAFVKSFFRHVL